MYAYFRMSCSALCAVENNFFVRNRCDISNPCCRKVAVDVQGTEATDEAPSAGRTEAGIRLPNVMSRRPLGKARVDDDSGITDWGKRRENLADPQGTDEGGTTTTAVSTSESRPPHRGLNQQWRNASQARRKDGRKEI